MITLEELDTNVGDTLDYRTLPLQLIRDIYKRNLGVIIVKFY